MLWWPLPKIQLDGKNFVHCLSKLRVSDLILTLCQLYMVTSGPPQVNSHSKHFSYTHVGSTSAALTKNNTDSSITGRLHSYTPQQKMKPVTLELSGQIIHHKLFLDSFAFGRLNKNI